MAKPKDTDKEEATNYEEVVVRRNMLNLYTMPFTRNGIVYSLRIQPGVNRITDPDIIECINDPKSNKMWYEFLKPTKKFPHGVHEIITGLPKGTQQNIVFTAMDVNTCKQIVSETYSIPALEQMYADEEKKKSRKTVLTAITNQIDSQKSDDVGKH